MSATTQIASEKEKISNSISFQQILGIRFIVGQEQEAIDEISRNCGLVVVPSAPVLSMLTFDPRTREALLGADYAIADSVLMVLLWKLLQRIAIPKLSGLRYIRNLIEREDFRKQGANFWVMPTAEAAQRNVSWLRSKGVQVPEENIYVAPNYSASSEDPELLHRLNSLKPKHVVMGIGGGSQERVGFYLKTNLSYKPAIHCIGAAIGFLTGDQVHIPEWADRLGLGWLFRCFYDPKRFGPRYWEARHLVPLMLRYRERAPNCSAT